MASRILPESVLSGFTKIAKSSDEEYQKIFDAFESLPLTITQNRIFDRSNLPDDLNDVADALFGLYGSRSRVKVSLDSLIDDVVETLTQSETSEDEIDWNEDKAAIDKLRKRLSALLSISSLEFVAHAHEVLLSHSNTYSKCRILSDIRPVFGESVKEVPPAAVIVHMLNLGYYHAGDREEFVLALDTKDIDDLISVLERAKSKTEQLQGMIGAAGMKYIDVI
jgi:hypothetical protein